jgi:4-hydroxybenzoate polyprenyltransferase
MPQVINYLKLFRFDAALISFFTYLTGAAIAGAPGGEDLLMALLITGVSTNFIYSFNSWADRDIDRINKGFRPIPSGKIEARHALFYAVILLLLSCLYPFLVFKNSVTLILFLLLPLLGILYSAKPFRFRSQPLLSILTISTGLVIPILTGYLMNTPDLSALPFFMTLYLYCLFVIPLKQIEEEKEDITFQAPNLYLTYGKGLLLFSAGGLFFNFFISFFIIQDLELRISSLLFNLSTLILIVAFLVLQRHLNRLYHAIIRMVIVESAILFALLTLFF